MTAIMFTMFNTVEITPNVRPAIPSVLEPPFLAWCPRIIAIIATINPIESATRADSLIWKIPIHTQGKKNNAEMIILKIPLKDELIKLLINDKSHGIIH